MPRPLRPDIEDGWVHVMNRGADRADVFFADDDRVQMGHRLAEMFQLFGVETHAYCLMDNHYHFLLHCPCGGLSPAMQRLGSIYTRHVNDRLGRDGALFRGRFHSRLITQDAHLIATARYIHRNALDLPGVDRVDGYRWSSHRTYLGYRTVPPWMQTHVVLSHFGGDSRAFDDFVNEESSVAAVSSVTVDDLRALVEAVTLVLAQDGVDDRARLGARARAAALAWSDSVDEVSNRVLMEAFGIESEGALRSARSRARRLLASDPSLRVVVERGASLVIM